jgi:hypothetical protein
MELSCTAGVAAGFAAGNGLVARDGARVGARLAGRDFAALFDVASVVFGAGLDLAAGAGICMPGTPGIR